MTAHAARPLGGDLVVKWLVSRGITHFFHVPGESFLPILNALEMEPSIRVVTGRHESGSSFGAEGFAKISGRPAVCMGTRGPGASNLSIGIQTAYYDGTPLLAFLGQVSPVVVGSRAFQEIDPGSLFGSMSKRVLSVTRPESLLATLDQAYEIAVAGRPGPVVVSLSWDVLEAELPDAMLPHGRRAHSAGQLVWDPNGLMGLIAEATHPVLLVATDPLRSTAGQAITEFATSIGLPVFAAWRRWSSVDNGHPAFGGSLGPGMRAQTADAIASSDLVVCFGFALEEITVRSANLNRPGVTIVQIAVAPDPEGVRHVSQAEVLEIQSSPQLAAEQLVRWTQENRGKSQQLLANRRVASARTPLELAGASGPHPGDGYVNPDYFMVALDRVLPPDATVVSDAGNFTQWLLRHVGFHHDRAFLGPLNGAMGYGLPAALGAVLAAPTRKCWCIAGDGGFLMTSGEMETAVRLDLELVVIVINNSAYGTIKSHQPEVQAEGDSVINLGVVDFASLARSMGWQGWTITDDSSVESTLAEVSTTPGRRLVDVCVRHRPWAVG